MYQNNPMVTAASTSRFRPPAILTPIILLLLFYMSKILVLPFAFLWTNITASWQAPLLITIKYTVLSLVIPFGLIISIIFLWVKLIERRPIRSIGFPKLTVVKTYLKGFGLAIFLMSLFMILSLATGVYALENIKFNGNFFTVWISVLITLPGWIIQGASEEILTRGWLFQAASKKHVITGIIFSSTIFALLHLANNGITPLVLINLVLYGLFAIFYALKTQNLWAICGFHSAWNWVQGNVYGISVSGHDILGGSLLSPGVAHGSGILTGGVFGAEGSLFVSAILIVSIIWAIKNTDVQ